MLFNNEDHASIPKRNGDEKDVVETDSFGCRHIVSGLFSYSRSRYVFDVVFDVKMGG